MGMFDDLEISNGFTEEEAKITPPKQGGLFDDLPIKESESGKLDVVINKPSAYLQNDTVEGEDSTTTRSSLDMTDVERGELTDSVVKDVMKNSNRLNPKGNITPDQLEDITTTDIPDIQAFRDAGYDERTIEMITSEFRDMGAAPEEGLESDIMLPVTPEFLLVNKAAEPIMMMFGKIGTEVLKAWKTRGIPRSMVKAIEGGDEEAIATYLKTVDNLKALKLGDEALKGGKASVSNNVFIQQKFADEQLAKALPNFTKMMKEEAPFNPELGKTYKDVVTKFDDAMKADTDAAYEVMKEKASDLQFPVKDFKEKLHKKLTSEDWGLDEPALKKVMRELDYKARNLSSAQKGAEAELNKIQPKIEKLSKDLALAKKEGKDTRGLQNKLRALKEKKQKNKDLLPETEYMTEREMINTVVRLNSIARNSGRAFNVKDANMVAGVKQAAKDLDNYLGEMTKEFGSGTHDLWKAAQAKARARFETFGKPGNRTPLGKVLDSEDYNSVMSTLYENPHNVQQVVNQMNTVKPGTGDAVAEGWLNSKLKGVQTKSDGIISDRYLNPTEMDRSLSKLLDDEANVEVLNNMFGPEKTTQLRSLRDINANLKGLMDGIGGKEGPMPEGWTAFINEAEGFGVPKRALKVAKDFVYKSAGEIVDNISKKPIPGVDMIVERQFRTSTEIMDRMVNYMHDIKKTTDPTLKKYFEKRIAATSAALVDSMNTDPEEVAKQQEAQQQEAKRPMNLLDMGRSIGNFFSNL